jgi:hypothetical protein
MAAMNEFARRSRTGFRGGEVPPVNPAAGTTDLLARITVLEQDRTDMMRVVAYLVNRLGGEVIIPDDALLDVHPVQIVRDPPAEGMILRVRR